MLRNPDSTPLRILAIHRYFWPDTPPYATILRSIAERWSADGHTVTVLSSQPSYKVELDNTRRPSREMLNEIDVRRCWLLHHRRRSRILQAINGLLFVGQVFGHIVLRPRRYHVIMCSTNPPVVLGWVASLAAKLVGARFIYHSMDIWPEVAVVTGMLRRGPIYRFLRWLDTMSCRRAAAVVCLSRDMQQTYLTRDGRLKNKVRVVEHFDLPAYCEPAEAAPSLQKQPGKFRVLFAGNLGRYQSLDTLLYAAQRLRDHPEIEFTFLGEGAAKATLVQRAAEQRLQNVTFLPHQSVAAAQSLIAGADLCVVSLAPGMIRVAFPCKTFSYLAAGRPLLVITDSDSQLWEFVQQHQVGFCFEPQQAEALAKRIASIADCPDELAATSARSRAIRQSQMTREKVLDRWSEMLCEPSLHRRRGAVRS